ncbi:MAG: RelA/SpoT family protein [Fimbriimonadales bacterium]
MISGKPEIPDQWEAPGGLLELVETLRRERPMADVAKIRLAYFLAEMGHQGQVRRTGDPYVTHPLAVAQILADLKMDEDTIIAALLHDVLEDTAVTSEQIVLTFGDQVLNLVEGVTKMQFPPIPVSSSRQASEERVRFAETMRKMLMAMANDFRVMVIKLADRLHNMQTLGAMGEEKRVQIAQQTLDIYAPLSARLGIWQIKWQLEDLAFKHLHPKEFDEVGALVAKTRKEREQELSEAIVQLKERLEAVDIRNAEVQGRPKHLYSIYEKMAVHGFEFEEIYDLIGIRVLLDTESECYQALGIAHDLWKPIPGLFFDYIAKPKSNGYQSLHTKVIGPHGEPMEVQMRTFEMHRMAEFGIASHWQYKARAVKTKLDVEEQTRLGKLRQQLFDWSSEANTGSEFLRSISVDLFSEQVFAFTPKGDVIDLPRGSTPLDFAFRVHSQVGLQTIGAKVNGRMVKLDHELDNGDIVEVMTRSNAQPSVDWLRIAKTANARSKIRAFLRQLNRETNAQRGREALERELKTLGYDPKEFLTNQKLAETAVALKKKNVVDLLSSVGDGYVGVTRAVTKLVQEQRKQERKARHVSPIAQVVSIAPGGVDNIAFRRSKCCLPVPGDECVGYISKGRGVILHRKLCPNLAAIEQTDPDRIIPVDWPRDGKGSFSANLRIQTVNRQGLLADIGNIFGESKTNVSSAKVRTLPNQTALLEMTVDVTDVNHLQSVINKIGSMQDVISIQRTFGGKAAS